MTESSRDDRLSESAREVKARKERICEVAPEHWEKSASRDPNGYSRYRAGQSFCREGASAPKIGGTAFDHALSCQFDYDGACFFLPRKFFRIHRKVRQIRPRRMKIRHRPYLSSFLVCKTILQRQTALKILPYLSSPRPTSRKRYTP